MVIKQETIKKYKGRWVALGDDEETVIASGTTIKEALEEALKKGHKEPLVFCVPEKILPFVGRVNGEVQIR